jgi:hypothetical protein
VDDNAHFKFPMPQVQKEYARPFLVEPTKLTRMVDKIHDRLAEQAEGAARDRFEVFMNGDRHEELTSLDQVLALDNSRKHKIQRLIITSSVGASEHFAKVQIDFGVTKTSSPGEPQAAARKVVAVDVRGNDRGWTSRTLSDVEEQVERTWQAHGSPTIALIVITAVALLFFVFQIAPRARQYTDTWNWLQASDIQHVEQMLGDGGTLTDEQVRRVETMQFRNAVIVHRQETTPPTADAPGRKLVLFGLPMLAIVICTLTLLLTCYPRAVFLWGDEIDRNNNRTQTRRLVWGIIVTLLVGGIVAKLLFEGVSPWIPKG